MGNIALAAFDDEMNRGGCRCLRYVDDFLLLGASEKEVNSKLRLAKRLLGELGMELSPEKSHQGARSIRSGFEFLGISLTPGLIRPTRKAQRRLLEAIEQRFQTSCEVYRKMRNGGPIEHHASLIESLKHVSGIIDGWGKHYWFCNDGRTLGNLNQRVDGMLGQYLGVYSDTKKRLGSRNSRRELLGVSELEVDRSKAFKYPACNPALSKVAA